MRHLMLAATMLTVALVITFGAASALEGVASAREAGLQDDQFQVPTMARPEMRPNPVVRKVLPASAKASG
jgi:hypothetical protein